MPVFFFPQLTSQDETVTLTDSGECHHACDVLRLAKNSAVGLLNGTGLTAEGVLTECSRNKVVIRVRKTEHKPPLQPSLHLYCAVPKRDRWEWILEKGTEIGVTSITPLVTQNSDVLWKKEDWSKKLKRQRNILISSAKQCGSPYLPTLKEPVTFQNYFAQKKDKEDILMPGLIEAAQPLREACLQKKSAGQLDILIGPEGDFSREEYAEATRSKVTMVTLGPQVLRVETAAIAAASFIRQYFL